MIIGKLADAIYEGRHGQGDMEEIEDYGEFEEAIDEEDFDEEDEDFDSEEDEDEDDNE